MASSTVDNLADPHRFWGIGEVLAVSLPASLSMMSVVVMQFVDGWMVSAIPGIGPAAMAAQAAAGVTHFTCMSLMFGTLTVVNTFVAQNYGATRPGRCSQYVWAGLYLGWAFAAGMLLLIPAAPALFRMTGHESYLQALEVTYFRILVAGTAVFLSASTLDRFFYGTHQPRVVLVATVLGNAVNIVGDWVLIFGRGPIPAMGLKGAALATVCGAGVQLAVMAAVFLARPGDRRYRPWRGRRVHVRQLRMILKIGWPAGLQSFVDVFGWAMLIAFLVGRVGAIAGQADRLASTVHMTATGIAMRYMHVAFMPAIGIHIATTSLVGKYIGQGRPELVWRRVKAALLLAVIYMTLCGLVFLVFRGPLVRLFALRASQLDPAMAARIDDIVRIGGYVLVCAALFQAFDAVGIVFTGALRGAGDTLWPALVQIGLTVVLLIGGSAAVLVLLPQTESVGIWAAASVYIAVFGLVMALRFASQRWRQIDLLGPGAIPRRPVPAEAQPPHEGPPVAY